jgi:hypothetical protein
MSAAACTRRALANHSFQSLAGFGAKHALWLVSRECYVDRSSPLYGSRPVVFAHDEVITEIPENVAHEAAYRQAEIQIAAMREFVPDVHVAAEPALMRRWFKEAENSQGSLWPPRHVGAALPEQEVQGPTGSSERARPSVRSRRGRPRGLQRSALDSVETLTVERRPCRGERFREQSGRRRELVKRLGGICKNPNRNPKCTVVFNLEINHVNGRTWSARGMSSHTRVEKYWAEFEAGVALNVLCRSCNGGFAPSRPNLDRPRAVN